MTILVAGYINNGTIHTYEKDTVHEGIVHWTEGATQPQLEGHAVHDYMVWALLKPILY